MRFDFDYLCALLIAALLNAAVWALPLALLAAVLSLTLGRQLSASARAWLWWLVCAKMLVGLFCLGLSVPLPVLPAPALPAAASYAPTRAERIPAATSPAPPTPPSGVTTRSSGSESPRGSSPAPLAPAAQAKTDETQQRDARLRLVYGVVALWAAGALPAAGVAVWQFARVRSLIARGRPTQDPALTALLVDLAVRMGLPHAPYLLVLEDREVDPFATGLRRPVVVFSRADLDRFSAEELRLVLAHEMAHLRRGDLWLGLVPLLARIVFWWFPPVYAVARAYDNAREAACDEAALRATGARPSALGRLLTTLGTPPPPARVGGAAALTVASPHFRLLARRLKALERYASTRAAARRALAAGLVTFAVALAAMVPWEPVPVEAADGAPGDLSLVSARSRAPRAVNLDFAEGLRGWSLVQAEWDAQGFKPASDFTAATDRKAARPGADDAGPAVRITASGRNDNYTGILGQNLRGTAFGGKRVRFAAWLRTKDTSGAGLWVRLDAGSFQKNWAYNAGLGTLEGDTPWRRYEFVFDVPEGATGFAFGVEANGRGTVWVDDVTLEAVGNGVPTTPASWDSRGEEFTGKYQPDLTNGGFEDGLTGWEPGRGDGRTPTDVAATADAAVRHGGRAAAALSVKGDPGVDVSRVLTQSFLLRRYAGRTVRVSAYLKTKGLDPRRGAAGLWIRIDGGRWQKAWNARGGALTGDNDWTPVKYVVKVPTDAVDAEVGANLIGPGTVWVDDVAVEVLDDRSTPDKPDYDSE